MDMKSDTRKQSQNQKGRELTPGLFFALPGTRDA